MLPDAELIIAENLFFAGSRDEFAKFLKTTIVQYEKWLYSIEQIPQEVIDEFQVNIRKRLFGRGNGSESFVIERLILQYSNFVNNLTTDFIIQIALGLQQIIYNVYDGLFHVIQTSYKLPNGHILIHSGNPSKHNKSFLTFINTYSAYDKENDYIDDTLETLEYIKNTICKSEREIINENRRDKILNIFRDAKELAT